MCVNFSTCEVWESPSCGTRDVLEDNKDTSGFSEHELLDIMYDACHSSNSGKQAHVQQVQQNRLKEKYKMFIPASLLSSGAVLASTIMQYLQTMTAQSPEQDRLTALRQLLDPDCQDPHLSRDTFHATMREWIAQCSQDR